MSNRYRVNLAMPLRADSPEAAVMQFQEDLIRLDVNQFVFSVTDMVTGKQYHIRRGEQIDVVAEAERMRPRPPEALKQARERARTHGTPPSEG